MAYKRDHVIDTFLDTKDNKEGVSASVYIDNVGTTQIEFETSYSLKQTESGLAELINILSLAEKEIYKNCWYDSPGDMTEETAKLSIEAEENYEQLKIPFDWDPNDPSNW